jgi:hypothetical protein
MLKEVKEMREILMEHIYNMNILKESDDEKKKNKIMDTLIGITLRCGLDNNDIRDFIKDVNDDKVIDLSILDKGGNIINFINNKWIDFLSNLWGHTNGLGTTNAAAGEGEFMFIFCSKHLIKPKKGDLYNKLKNELIEVKGEQARVMGNISGKNFKEKTLKIASKFGLTPNKANTRPAVDAVELEKTLHKNHWNQELKNMDISEQKSFVNQWLMCIDDKEHKSSVERIFKSGNFDQESLIKEIVIILYQEMRSEAKLIMLGDGSNIQIVTNDFEIFKTQIYNNEIAIHKDYFRINQDYKIGWYLY